MMDWASGLEQGSGSAAAARAAAARRRLLARIHRRYATTTQRLEIGGLKLDFTRIADPDRVLDEVAEEADRLQRASGAGEADSLHLPYWAELWDSAIALGQFLVQQASGWGANGPGPVRVPRVLDLGCGMGLAGTVAAALGAKVLFADLEPQALLLARLNSLPFAAVNRNRAVGARRLDWRSDRLGERFDLIVGADILYERQQWTPLEAFWRAHVAPGGAVALGEPGRASGDVFPQWAAEAGWVVGASMQRISGRETPLRIFRLTLMSAAHQG